MGSGSFSFSSFSDYSISKRKLVDASTGRVSSQTFEASRLDESLDPNKFNIRECRNTEEHPNTIPVILALDVTGSMGKACDEVASTLGILMTKLYKKYKDIEFCVMGIGDIAYDKSPIQMSQFESDVRIAESLDKIYMEHGGGGNCYESYTAAWYMGLKHTQLDCYDKQGRKGIIITMGDEELNPYLSKGYLEKHVKDINEQSDIETKTLYEAAKEKFDIYHIAVDDSHNSYHYHKYEARKTFGDILGSNFKEANINTLANVIEECIDTSVQASSLGQNCYTAESTETKTNVEQNGGISW